MLKSHEQAKYIQKEIAVGRIRRKHLAQRRKAQLAARAAKEAGAIPASCCGHHG